MVMDKKIPIVKVDGKRNPADVLTKYVKGPMLQWALAFLNMQVLNKADGAKVMTVDVSGEKKEESDNLLQGLVIYGEQMAVTAQREIEELMFIVEQRWSCLVAVVVASMIAVVC